jgi:hypothetical protein
LTFICFCSTWLEATPNIQSTHWAFHAPAVRHRFQGPEQKSWLANAGLFSTLSQGNQQLSKEKMVDKTVWSADDCICVKV